VALIMAIRVQIERMRWRRLDFELRALGHNLSAMKFDGRGAMSCRGPEFPDFPCTVRDPSKAAYHTAMARKWAEAAKHPWFPIAPDLPEPD
jgi:hypothetical protein